MVYIDKIRPEAAYELFWSMATIYIQEQTYISVSCRVVFIVYGSSVNSCNIYVNAASHKPIYLTGDNAHHGQNIIGTQHP